MGVSNEERPVEVVAKNDRKDNGLGSRPSCFSSTTTEILFVLTATMAIMASSLTGGSVSVLSSYVARDVHMTNAQVTWIAAASQLSAGAFLLFFGRAADLFGRKWLFVPSLGLYTVFALGMGFANNGITLDVLSGFLGLMSAAAVPPAVGALGATYDKPCKRKNYAFAVFSAGNPLGFVMGLIFSGIATDLFSWRASFWLMAIIYAFITVLAYFTMPADGFRRASFSLATLKRFDVTGALLTVGGIDFVSCALSLAADAPRGWDTPYVLVLLILGILLCIAFVSWEFCASYPLVPMGIWRDRDFSLLIAIQCLGSATFSTSAFFLALYLQLYRTNNALEVAVLLLPMAIVGLAVNVFAGLVLHKLSNKIMMAIGSVAWTLSSLLYALYKDHSSYWAFFFPGLILSVVGADLEFNVCQMYVMSSMPLNSNRSQAASSRRRRDCQPRSASVLPQPFSMRCSKNLQPMGIMVGRQSHPIQPSSGLGRRRQGRACVWCRSYA